MGTQRTLKIHQRFNFWQRVEMRQWVRILHHSDPLARFQVGEVVDMIDDILEVQLADRRCVYVPRINTEKIRGRSSA